MSSVSAAFHEATRQPLAWGARRGRGARQQQLVEAEDRMVEEEEVVSEREREVQREKDAVFALEAFRMEREILKEENDIIRVEKELELEQKFILD